MDAEKKQGFIRRITQSNKSELVVVLYDIFFEYAGEALCGYENGTRGDAASREAILHASEVLSHLIESLNFDPACRELSLSLLAIYRYCQKQLLTSLFLGNADGIREAETRMRELYESFIEVAKQDSSAPLMKNTENTVAGYTYGRNDVNELGAELNPSRGFFV